MPGFLQLLRGNRNYRNTWMGQIVSEVGDHFNNISVLSLAMAETHSGGVIAGLMLSRAIPAVLIGPVAGVLLDRFDRKRIMIVSDLVRGVIALGFILAIRYQETWLLYVLSAMLMIASPFFTSGRSAILPAIATDDELHTANSLTQTTGWMTLTVGAFLGGTTVARFGYELAFVFNSLSFFFSALCISRLSSVRGHFRAENRALNETKIARPWHEYREGLGYMIHSPLILGIGLIFSQMRHWGWALFFMALSRASVAVSSVLNWSNLLKHVEDRFRGRVFSTIETMNWSTMMLSMMGAGIASTHFSVRAIGAASGLLSSSTAAFWGWANWTGKLPEPVLVEDQEPVEVHGDPTA